MFILHDVPGFCPNKAQQAQRLWFHLEPEELMEESKMLQNWCPCPSALALAGPQSAIFSLGAVMEAPLQWENFSMDISIHSSHGSDPPARWRWLSIRGLSGKAQSNLTSKLVCIKSAPRKGSQPGTGCPALWHTIPSTMPVLLRKASQFCALEHRYRPLG